jgi:cytochrome bd-type quinol oxidase subunit 1
MAMWMLLLVTPVQMEIGDAHGLNTLKHQPAKIAAIEGHRQNVPGQSVPLIQFGWPNMTAETTRYALEVPALGGLNLDHLDSQGRRREGYSASHAGSGPRLSGGGQKAGCRRIYGPLDASPWPPD